MGLAISTRPNGGIKHWRLGALSLRGAVEESARVFRIASFLLPIAFACAVALAFARNTTQLDDPWMVSLELVFLGVLFAALLVRAIAGRPVQYIFQLAWLRWLGKVSYGVYVYHILFKPLFQWVVARCFPSLGAEGSLVALFFVATVGTLVIATMSFYMLESPFLKFKDRMAAKHHTTLASQ